MAKTIARTFEDTGIPIDVRKNARDIYQVMPVRESLTKSQISHLLINRVGRLGDGTERDHVLRMETALDVLVACDNINYSPERGVYVRPEIPSGP